MPALESVWRQGGRRWTFYYLCSVLDGYSRYLVHWEIRESMTEAEVEIIFNCSRAI